MGILKDFKNLFWAKKAVAKSAADKVADKTGEFADDLSDRISDAWNKGVDKTEVPEEKTVPKTKESFQPKDKSSDPWDKKEDWTQKEPPPLKKEESEAFKAGEKIGEVAGKVGLAAEKTWDKAKEEGKELIDKAVKTSDKVWEKAEDISEDLWDKAKTVANKANEKFQEGVDSMLEKAKELDKKIEEEKDKVDANRDGWADKPVHEKLKEHSSTLKNKDDFFERAERYAEGDYSMGKPVVSKPEKENPDTPEEGMTPLPPLPKDDSIVDDAILDEDDDKK